MNTYAWKSHCTFCSYQERPWTGLDPRSRVSLGTFSLSLCGLYNFRKCRLLFPEIFTFFSFISHCPKKDLIPYCVSLISLFVSHFTEESKFWSNLLMWFENWWCFSSFLNPKEYMSSCGVWGSVTGVEDFLCWGGIVQYWSGYHNKGQDGSDLVKAEIYFFSIS